MGYQLKVLWGEVPKKYFLATEVGFQRACTIFESVCEYEVGSGGSYDPDGEVEYVYNYIENISI